MLAKNTQIIMADGSTKYMRDIKIGESLLTPNNDRCIVEDIITGREDIMLELMIDNKTIKASEDQIIMTTFGLKRAVDIKTDDKLILVGEQEMKVNSMIHTKNDDTVYLIMLDKGHLFFAEDIVVGDWKIAIESYGKQDDLRCWKNN